MSATESLACSLTMNSVLTPEQREKYQNPDTIRRILATAKTVAIVGLSGNPQRPSSFVASYLKHEGYQIIPVNPNETEILGEKCYPSLLQLPEAPDVVEVFRRADQCPEIARDAVQIGAKALWLQLRVVSLEAALIAEAAGMDVVMDRCLKIEHGRFNGSLHWVGMNTELISSRRGR